MPFGRFGSFPFRMGGGKPLARTIYESLNRELGTGYDTSEESTVTAETAAEARCLAIAWRQNERASFQHDPNRVTDFLARWETIFGLKPKATDSLSTRRAQVAAKWATMMNPDPAGVYTVCSVALGSLLVAVEYTPLANSVQHWPGNGYPEHWHSTTAHILVRVTQPTTTTDGTFLAKMTSLMALLDDFLPDCVTCDWGVWDSDGDRGFRLDERNLNWETFS
jgi:uncharacterized protein YmfQ (DUF2313 family)